MPYKDREKRLAYNHAYSAAHQEEIRACKRAYYEVHQEEIRACKRAYREVHLEERRACERAYNETHREERNAYQRAYYIVHREEAHAYMHIYRKVHLEEINVCKRAYAAMHPYQGAEVQRRRRARKWGVAMGPIDRAAIKVRDRMHCVICHKKVNEKLKYPHPDSLSFDHSHPLGLLGPHSQENQRVAHLRCNQRRGTGRLPVQMVLV